MSTRMSNSPSITWDRKDVRTIVLDTKGETVILSGESAAFAFAPLLRDVRLAVEGSQRPFSAMMAKVLTRVAQHESALPVRRSQQLLSPRRT
jgi:hypothetical protein